MAPRMWYSSRWTSVAAAHPKRPQHWRFPARQADPGGIEDPSSIEKILTQVERKDAATIAAGLLPCRAPREAHRFARNTSNTGSRDPDEAARSQCGVTYSLASTTLKPGRPTNTTPRARVAGSSASRG